MKSEFLLAFNQICNERGLSQEVVMGALEVALVSAYRRSTGASAAQNVIAKIDLDTGDARIFVSKEVVDEVEDPETQISMKKAHALDAEAAVGDEVLMENTPSDFGRIAAQNAKQIILQRIREAEREAQYEHYVQQEGEIVHGTVHSLSSKAIVLHLEGAEAVLPRSQQVPGERYSLHQRVRAYVLEVRKTSRGPQITVSRSHKDMLRRLLELEVPEIFNGAVEIKAIAREAGSRSKIAVAARQPGVDPVGACVGMRGVRIQSIVNELGGEKIDVIEWDSNPANFIAKALSPAKVLTVQLDDDPVGGKTASVIVPDDQLSLAIGRSGQNARLAAKLTGWRIDIQSVTEATSWALKKVNEDEDVLPSLGATAELLPKVVAILREHEREDMPYSGEELLALRKVIEAVWGYYASIRDAERRRRKEEEVRRQAIIRAAEAQKHAELEAARSRIPDRAYEISVADMDLSARVLGHLERAGIETAGDILERMAEGDEGLLKLDGFGPRSLSEVKEGIETLDLPQEEEAEEDAGVSLEDMDLSTRVTGHLERAGIETAGDILEHLAEGDEALLQIDGFGPKSLDEVKECIDALDLVEPEAALVEEPAAVQEAVEPAAEPEEAPVEVEPAEPVTVEEAEAPAETPVEEPVKEPPAPAVEAAPVEAAAEEAEVEDEEEEAEIEELEPLEEILSEQEKEIFFGEEEEDEEQARQRERRLRRQLVYDEETGMLIARRRRKRSRRSDDWEDMVDY
jgi:N utilization substance protein A